MARQGLGAGRQRDLEPRPAAGPLAMSPDLFNLFYLLWPRARSRAAAALPSTRPPGKISTARASQVRACEIPHGRVFLLPPAPFPTQNEPRRAGSTRGCLRQGRGWGRSVLAFGKDSVRQVTQQGSRGGRGGGSARGQSGLCGFGSGTARKVEIRVALC